jgi:hypothetical protein
MEGAILQESTNTLNSNTDNNDIEHTRQLLLEILRQRKVSNDPETGKMLDDKTDIQTLLNIIQNEKEKEKVKKKRLDETFNKTDKSAKMKIQPSYPHAYNPWYPNYRLATELIYELTMAWLLFLVMNPVTGWFYYPIVVGWTQ